MPNYKHISFFSGIGGFDIAAENVGFENVAHVEINPFCRKVLANLYPHSLSFSDINDIKQTLPEAQIYTAGFPCQDASQANATGKGTNGQRTGLFRKLLTICGNNRPKYIILENVPNLLNRGFENVLCELFKIGYDCQWTCLQATKFGYPHQRERLFIVAYSNGFRCKSLVFGPDEDFALYRTWKASETYSHFANRWNEGYRHSQDLHRVDEFREVKALIQALGNAVMPVMAEYVFRKVIEFDKIHS